LVFQILTKKVKQYELKIRQAVVDFINNGGSKIDAARRFNLSRSTVYRCIAADGKGTLEPKKRIGVGRKIDPDVLRKVLEENPDATLSDLSKIFNAHFVTVWHCLEKMGVKLKRAHMERPSKNTYDGRRSITYMGGERPGEPLFEQGGGFQPLTYVRLPHCTINNFTRSTCGR